MPTYQVAVLQTNRDYFHYTYPVESLLPGTRVWVPFRQKTKLGIILDLEKNPSNSESLKSILTVLEDYPLITSDILNLCRWMGRYYHASMAQVLALALPKGYRQGKTTISLDFIQDKLTHKIPLSEALVLNIEQQRALEALKKARNSYHCFLLYGVTGSGKTEVYLQMITEVLNQGRQVLILVPEIGLTPQLEARFQERFTESMVVIHSQMRDKMRQQAWQWARDKKVQLVIGTRSALFTPMPALGLIIIDEEHDSSLKQMEGVRYWARDTALMRAYTANIPIILGSATPSLESLANVARGKYTVLPLTKKAMNQHPLRYEVVDLRQQALRYGVANQTLTVIKRHLHTGNQVLVFINRRGFSPVLLCHLCGWTADCQACDARLTLHSVSNQLLCHHCGYTEVRMLQCPHCQGRALIPLGAGTQRIEEYLRAELPETSILRIDRDTVTKKKAFDQCLENIHTGHAQLIIGTQMLAKGHHFARLSLVVVVDADYGFYDQDFRALERLGQLITQVSGRAGRAEIPGEVIIQTHVPDHPLLNTLIQQGYDPFAQSLLKLRQQAALPPYAFLALLRVQGSQEARVGSFIQRVKESLVNTPLTILGPAPAPLAKKGGQYRMQLLLKSTARPILQAVLSDLGTWMSAQKNIGSLRWSLDVDPLDLS